MKYWMKFINNDNDIILSTSTITFLGDDLNIDNLKSRFNTNFVKDINAKGVEISFLGKGVNKTFICGIRNKSIVIIDTTNNQEFTPKEFSIELNTLKEMLEPKLQTTIGSY